MSGERVDSAHFSIRAYGGTQTVHLFPIRRDLIRTLNLRVGYHRQWIPKPTETGTEAFMKAYDKADKLSKEMVEIASKSGMGPSRYRRNVIDAARLRWDRDEARLDGDVMRARDAINDAIEGVLRKHNFLDAIEQEEKAAQVANEGGGKESGAQLLLLGMG